MNADSAIAAPPPASELSFPDARRLRSRDVFRLVARVWPFIRPYRRHLGYLFLATLPTLLGGLVALNLVRVFFDVVGHGAALTPAQAWMLDVPLHADRRLVLIHGCVLGAVGSVAALIVVGVLFGYAIWILQRISNLFRVNLYTRMQELSVRFHSEEKIGDAIFRMFQDSAAIPNVISGLIVQPLIFIPAAIGSLLYLLWYDYPMALIAALLMPANFMLAWIFGDSMRAAFIVERETMARATTRIEETLASIKTVKAFGTEAREADNYARDNWDAFLAARRARLMLARYRAVTNTVRGLAYVAALYVGATEVMAGGTAGLAHVAVSLGLFQGSIALFASVSARTRNLTNSWGSMQDVVVAISRVLEMLGQTPEHGVSSGRAIPPKVSTLLAFDGVTFGYDPRTPVLDRRESRGARRGDHRDRRPQRLRQEHHHFAHREIFRSDGGAHPARRRADSRLRSSRLARDAFRRAAGKSALQRDASRQRRVRTPERVDRRSCRSDSPRRPRRFRSFLAGRPRHHARRERLEAFRRPGAAARPRPRDLARRADSYPRRTDLRAGCRDRRRRDCAACASG